MTVSVMFRRALFKGHRMMVLALVASIFAGVAGWSAPAMAAPAAAQSYVAATTNYSQGTVVDQATARLKQSWTWYVARASGFAAVILLVLLMLSGMGLVTGYTYKFIEPLMAWAVHRAMGIALLVSIVLHMGVLLFDKFVPFDLIDLFVPFMSQNKKFNTPTEWQIGVGVGVLAMYATILVVLTSLVFINKRARMWRLVHFTSYAMMAAVFVHGFFIGTDVAKGAVRIAWIAIGVVILGALVTRLYRARTISGSKHRW